MDAIQVLDDDSATALAEFFRIMADPTRVRLLSALAHQELCVHDLQQALNMEQSAISHQLKALRSRQLVRFRKVGRQVYYSLDRERTPEFFLNSMDNARQR